MSGIIEVKDVVKKCRKGLTIDRVSFNVNQGDLFALLGKTGAGKTTVLQMLCGLIKCDSGSIVIGEQPVGKKNSFIRKNMGIAFQNSVLDKFMSVRENLYIRGSVYQLGDKLLKENIQQLCILFEMEEFLKRPYGKLSVGQKRRVDIARALVHKPEILLLDEPTTGLDPEDRTEIWGMILELQKELGMTVCFTARSIEDAANANYLSILNNGEIIERGTPEYIKNKHASDCLKLFGSNANAVNYLKSHRIQFRVNESVIYIQVASVQESLNILNYLHHDIDGYEMKRGNSEDIFLSAMDEWEKKDGEIDVE